MGLGLGISLVSETSTGKVTDAAPAPVTVDSPISVDDSSVTVDTTEI